MFEGFNNIPKVTKNLILVNLILFLATLINQEFMTRTFALFYPASTYFHFWQPLTHMFMHGNFWHIFFNMYTLFIFGSVLERVLGPKKFIIFYFVCGFGAAALHLGVQFVQAQLLLGRIAEGSQAAMQQYIAIKSIPTVGASGAIYGLLIGYAMLFPQSRLTLIFPPISLSAKAWVLIFVAIELFTGITGTADGIAHFAHLGGMLFGFILIKLWRRKGGFYNQYYY